LLSIEILDINNNIKLGQNFEIETPYPMHVSGAESVYLAAMNCAYADGDSIRITNNSKQRHVVVKLDETLSSSLIYMQNNTWIYPVPMQSRCAMPENAFLGKARYLSVRLAYDFEITQYRNLTLNAHDQHEDCGVYPHAYANFETRSESAFLAKNVIDGIYANASHGLYPFQSWGINKNPDAKLIINFGRKVCIDRVSIVLRADFPHDSYWTQATLCFSNDQQQVVHLQKTAARQDFIFEPMTTEILVFETLIKADDASPFPALTQLEAFGVDVSHHC